jgi:peptidoglycan-N-acetylglucosamine deacetylase
MPARSVARAAPGALFPRPGALLASIVLAACSLGPTSSPSPTALPPSASAEPIATAASVSPSASPSARPTLTVPTATPGPSFLVYEVVAGDSLTSIARKFGTTPRSIAYWNRDAYPNLDHDSKDYTPDKIEIGWKLRLMPNVTLDDQGPLPSRRSTPLPFPSGTRPPPPTLPPDGSSLLVSNGRREGHEVALTFDLGGEIEPSLDVVTWLIRNDIPAAIFVNGQAGTTGDPGRQTLQLVGAHPDLFGLGNYSWDGAAYTELSSEQIRDELQLTEDAIFTATGRSTKPFFRPPLGAQDGHVRAAASELGWPYMVMWDVDALDAKAPADGGPTAADIVAKVLSRARAGSIVLLHLGGYHTLEALPGIVDGLRGRGLEPVTLNTLLGL